MKKKDGRLVASINEVRVLRALRRFGWLRAIDVAALVWRRWEKHPVSEPKLAKPEVTASALRMAQRTLRRLVDAREVLCSSSRGDLNGRVIYALAEAGARRLRTLGIPAETGKDLIRRFSVAHFQHRVIANEIAISGICCGFKASPEREVAQGRSICGIDGVAGKKADVLLIGDRRVWWYEVERSRKNSKEYAKLLTWLSVVARDALRTAGSKLLPDGLGWAKVVFVCTPVFMKKLIRDLQGAGWPLVNINSLVLFETSLYAGQDIIFA